MGSASWYLKKYPIAENHDGVLFKLKINRELQSRLTLQKYEKNRIIYLSVFDTAGYSSKNIFFDCSTIRPYQSCSLQLAIRRTGMMILLAFGLSRLQENLHQPENPYRAPLLKSVTTGSSK